MMDFILGVEDAKEWHKVARVTLTPELSTSQHPRFVGRKIWRQIRLTTRL